MADEAQLPSLVNQGVIRPNTLLWSEILSDWTEAAKVQPALFGGTLNRQSTSDGIPALGVKAPPSPASSLPVGGIRASGGDGESVRNYRELGKILSKSSGWLRFVGVLNFIGFIYIVPIFIGIKCFGIASAADEAARSGDLQQVRKAVTQISGLFILQGATALAAIFIYIVIFFLGLSFSS